MSSASSGVVLCRQRRECPAAAAHAAEQAFRASWRGTKRGWEREEGAGGGAGAPPAGTRRAVHGVAVVGVAEIGHDLTDQVVLANSAASHGLDRLHLSNRSQRNAKHRIRRL